MSPPNVTAATLAALGRKRLEKFAALIPRIVVNDDSATIHDARVGSRRSQQILGVLAGPFKKKASSTSSSARCAPSVQSWAHRATSKA